MYTEFFGLSCLPFGLTQDVRFCFSHPSFAKAKSYLQYALHRGEGFVIVTGRSGTGKTTLVQDLLKDLQDMPYLVSRLDCSRVGIEDLLRLIANSFGIEAKSLNHANLLLEIEGFVRRRPANERRVLLILDEAQNLSIEALDEVRLLTNLQEGAEPLVQIFLTGQEALRSQIRHPGLEQLHQRIIAACHLEPLSAQETRAYVRHRLLLAGWKGDPVFEAGALAKIHLASGGLPRLVNKFCDRLLLHSALEERHTLTSYDAEVVLEEFCNELLEPIEYGNAVSDEQLPHMAEAIAIEGLNRSDVPEAVPTRTFAEAGEKKAIGSAGQESWAAEASSHCRPQSAEARKPPIPTSKIDPEYVDIFLEETVEETQRIREQLRRWRRHHEDETALTSLCRSFQTLKGSGRLVGALRVGEVTHSVEILLNRILDQTLPITPEIVGYIEEAVTLLPNLVSAEVDGCPMDVTEMIERAQVLADPQLRELNSEAEQIETQAGSTLRESAGSDLCREVSREGDLAEEDAEPAAEGARCGSPTHETRSKARTWILPAAAAAMVVATTATYLLFPRELPETVADTPLGVQSQNLWLEEPPCGSMLGFGAAMPRTSPLCDELPSITELLPEFDIALWSESDSAFWNSSAVQDAISRVGTTLMGPELTRTTGSKSQPPCDSMLGLGGARPRTSPLCDELPSSTEHLLEFDIAFWNILRVAIF